MQFSWKMSLLVICKILALFVNTLTADGKYCLLDRDNLLQDVQTQKEKKNTVFHFLLHYENLD